MHDLVVAHRQHEPLAERVEQPERQLAMMPAAMDRVGAGVAERVVHPAEVPLVGEPETAVLDRVGHLRPRGALFGDHHRRRHIVDDRRVELPKEVDGVEVLAAAESVRDPPTGPARVVEVQHAGNCIDAQAVDVELVQPVQRVGNQEVAHLVTAVVEDQRAPVGMLALARVAVLVELCSIEQGQAPFVAREVGGHPIEDHADPALMKFVDEGSEVVGCPKTCCRRVVTGDLVAPRTTKRMFGDGKQFDVSEAEGADVVGDLDGQLAIRVDTVTPRREVHLVDAQRMTGPVPARGHPRVVSPGMGCR